MPRAEMKVARRKASDNAVTLGVLDAVERNPAVTQRSVARDLGIALGLVNAYLQRCLRKGLIKVGQVPPRRYAYYLTPRGMSEKSRLTAAYLMNSFAFFREARSQCDALFKEMAAHRRHRVVLIGGGDLAEVARLIARDHSVEILDIVPAGADVNVLAPYLERLGVVDAAVVTSIELSRETFAAAAELLGAQQVYAPALLRVPPVSAPEGGGRVR